MIITLWDFTKAKNIIINIKSNYCTVILTENLSAHSKFDAQVKCLKIRYVCESLLCLDT